ncbi:patatin-like phospholipase family protein [Herminiimonas contaminans]|uniref:Patatin-like phospholipase family protein n=1 Tax=Herminiimonas contaminans TaxID=1111140 RepID=A0ABS0ETZ9_9BURK|nr:patatin-like phospholipase family protein [Herminiimonas contaminans]MBF8176653.1 patatin-like phospholipase family protein [Herminiimonas contaminans]
MLKSYSSKILLAGLLVLQAACSFLPGKSEPVTPVVVTPKSAAPVKIALVLGGGAARGFAHIGVIKALESQGIVPDMVVGTSAGSVVGALYAAGNNGFALQQMALAMDEAAISDWSVPFFAKSSGVLKGDALQNYVNKAVKNVPIEKMKIPFAAVATDLNSGQPVLFQRGNTGLAVRASSAVPGLFQPVKIGERMYVDGGLVAPVPVHFAKEMGADFIIAVNISVQPEVQLASSSLDVLLQTFAIMGQSLNRFELKDADIVVRPNLGDMKGNDFNGRNRAVLAGEQAAMALMPELKKKLASRREQ